MPGVKRTKFQVAASIGNAAIDKIGSLEMHWRHLSDGERAKILAPVEDAVARLRDLNNRKHKIDTSEDVSA